MSLDAYPKISVVIPALNEELNIGTCLRSIFAQNYPKEKIDVIVVDGNSTDQTVNLAKNFPVRILKNSKGLTGISRKMGVEAASGELIAFIDADNELPHAHWFSDMVSPLLTDDLLAGTIPRIRIKRSHPPASRLYSLMEASPLVSVAFSNARTLCTDKITEKTFFPFGGNGLMIKKKVILEAGNYRSIRGQEDVDLTFRVVKLGYYFRMMFNTNIYHLSHRTLRQLHRKSYSRMLSFLNNYSSLTYKFTPTAQKGNLVANVFLNVFLLRSLIEVGYGYKRDKDMSWLYYPILFYYTFLMFGALIVFHKEGRMILRRLY